MDNLPIYKVNLAKIETLEHELAQELDSILNWWAKHMPDTKNGGFFGEVNNQNIANTDAPKGLVLNARILYTFSSAYLLNKRKDDLEIADRAYRYLIDHFLDLANGGFYWSVNAKGKVAEGRKQIYGQAFVIYGLAEYFRATKNENALALAKATYKLIEAHSFDPNHLGYIEALTTDWKPITDLRLSEKDQNEKKSMNTHLHVIEAYANLFSVWPDGDLKTAVKQLLRNFEEHIIDPKTFHLNLFFDEDWEIKSNIISFGHDIEAAWLLYEAAQVIDDPAEISKFKTIALQMAAATEGGMDINGGLYYEYDPVNNHWISEFHWWPQAEAMVGFYNAYQICGEEKYLNYTLNCWSFIKNNLKDTQNGEWFWGLKHLKSNATSFSLLSAPKAGFWKCPYHNGRACIELLRRMAK